ncbi:MFS transporter [Massilia sp. CF038]|uniref:MFS transporter n=1 Tax=Massilia sp. CF038 TaxID=1881045 RepID=UPI00091C6C88|nr:MFS transporter [Massilia sp. CF038]SHG75378.1 Predicted arabinose efflux permease, MFS family [Massilia sp. CF038]
MKTAVPTLHPHTSPAGALAALALPMLLASLGTSSISIALPTLAQQFGVAVAPVQWIVLSYLLAVTTLVLSMGRLGDLLGRRRLLQCGLLVFIAGALLCAAAPDLPLLVAARAAQGLGAAIMMALSLAMVADVAAHGRSGSAMGWLGTTSAIGTALGPSLGGALLSAYGWQALFLLNLPLGVLALVLVRRFLPSVPPARAGALAAFDFAGTVWLALTLGMYAFALSASRASLLLVAAMTLGLFLRRQMSAAQPLLPLALLRTRTMSAGTIMSAMVSAVVMATLVVGPFYLTSAVGLTAAATGLAMSSGPLVSALCAWPAGRLVDRFGSAALVAAGLVGMLLACILFVLLPPAAGLAGYVAPLCLLTASYALFQTANNADVMGQAAPGQRGLASGLLNMARNLGLISGAAAAGVLFASASGPHAGLQRVFAWAGGLITIGLVMGLARRRAKP